MAGLVYLVAVVVIALSAYYWYTNNQLKSQLKDTSRLDESSSRASTSGITDEKFLDFDDDCKIRRLTSADLDVVQKMVKGKSGCGYFSDHALTPFLNDVDNDRFLGYGVVLNSNDQVVCTQFVQMVDDNQTALIFGAMFDTEYASNSRIMFMRLSNEIQDQLTGKFEHLGKYRCVQVEDVATSASSSYVNNAALDWKVKFNLDAMSSDDVFLVAHGYEDVDGVQVNGDFKECSDAQAAVDVLAKQCQRSDVLLDWRLFQVQFLGQALDEDLKAKKTNILINVKQTAVVFVYAEHHFYVYGATDADVLSGVRFALSQSSGDNLAIYACKTKVEGNTELSEIFAKAVKAPIVGLDYDIHIDGH